MDRKDKLFVVNEVRLSNILYKDENVLVVCEFHGFCP